MADFITEESRQTPVIRDVDVLVIGGSQSGVAAAVSAKRAVPSQKVLLIEQNGYLGGQSVADMVVHWEFREYTNNEGKDITAGIGKEMIRRIAALGHSDPLYTEWLEGRGPPFTEWADQRAVGDIPLDLEDIKFALLEMCEEAGVDLLFLAKAVAPIVDKNNGGSPTCRGAIIETYSGRFAIKARVVVDCSANNDIAYWIGGNDAITVPDHLVMNMQAYLWIGGVDCLKFIEGAWADGSFKTNTTYPNNKEQMIDFLKRGISITFRGGPNFLARVDEDWEDFYEEYDKTQSLPPLYFWLKTLRTHEIGGKIIGTWAVEGPPFLLDQTDYETVSKVHANLLHACRLLLRVHQYLPGWEDAYIERTPAIIGFRQTRVLKGAYVLTEDDVLSNARFEDAVGLGSGHDISRHHPNVESGYQIPYRALIPEKIDGLLVGARSISCETDDIRLVALNAHRGISATIVVSQGAGVAAALSVKNGVEPRNLDISALQEELRNQNVILE